MALLMLRVFLSALFVSEISSEASQCTKNNDCIPLSQCNPQYLSSILYPCHSGLNLYCCPTKAAKNETITNLLNRRKHLFPVNCGVVAIDNKITGGDIADLGQFPWMALLGYKQKRVDFIEYLCGGTIITETYVLTAAHCIGVGKHHKLVQVRLGEHDLRSSTDCQVYHGKRVCSDNPVDIPVLSTLRHPNYHTRTLKNDIALVRLKTIITFTDFIQPICLPFERKLDKKVFTGQKFIVCGWGKTDSRNLGGSPTLQFASVSVWDQKNCNKVVPPEVQPITGSQLCANGKKEDACKGDSGGPLINSTVDVDGELRNFQIGIVSFASTLTCGIKELPPIYTRVDRYLEWIADNVK
nr:melanization protease 1-like [Leptinotarsa decemlineata]